MIKKFIRDHKVHKDIVAFSFFDYIFFCKPAYLFGPIAMVLVGMYLANFANGELVLGVSAINIKTLLFTLGLSLIFCCIFIKNEILSLSENVESRFGFIEKSIIGDKISIKIAEVIHNVLLGLGFGFIVGTSWINIFIVAAIYFSWLYVSSCPDDFYKSIVLFSLIAFCLLLSGWLYADNLFSNYLKLILFMLLSIPYVFLFSSTIILIQFSINKTNSFIATLLIMIGFIIAYYNNDPVGATTLSVSLPFYFFLLFRGAERDLIRAVRYPIFLLNFFLFTVYPLLMIPLTIIFYLSKYYYWHRFNIHFPALAINDDYN